MAIAFVQFASKAAWTPSLIGVAAGNSLIFFGAGQTTTTATEPTVTSDVDGNFNTDYFIESHGGGQEDVFACQYLHSVSSGTHTISHSTSGFNDTDCLLYEVSGLNNAASEASNQNTATAATTHPTGSVTTAGEAFLVNWGAYSANTAEVQNANFTKNYDDNRALGGYYIPTSGGSYNGDWTGNTSVDSGNVIVAYAAAAGGTTVGRGLSHIEQGAPVNTQGLHTIDSGVAT